MECLYYKFYFNHIDHFGKINLISFFVIQILEILVFIIFSFLFFFLYLLISYRLVDKKKQLPLALKLFIYILYLLIIFIQGFTYIITYSHYVHQLIFTLCISLILLCIMIDLDTIIHNFIFKSFKNIYKSRKYKMKIFFYVSGMCLSSVLLLFFIEDLNFNEIKDNLLKNNKCQRFDIINFGIKESFLEIDYIFYIIGSFWGASLTLEYNIKKWWDDQCTYSFLKVLVSIILNLFFILIKRLFTSLTFEILFIVQCVIYCLNGYLIFGILPYIIDSRKEKKIDQTNLFRTSFFYNDEKMSNNYNVVDNNEELINNNKESNLLSSLVYNVQKHSSEDELEFNLKDQYEELNFKNDNIPLFKEDDI